MLANLFNRLIRRVRGQGRRHGFTLIEVAIALFVLSFGIIGIISVFPVGASAARDVVSRTIATNIAMSNLEKWSADPSTWAASGTDANHASFSWTSSKGANVIADYDGTTDCVPVSITVSRTGGSTWEFATYIRMTN